MYQDELARALAMSLGTEGTATAPEVTEEKDKGKGKEKAEDIPPVEEKGMHLFLELALLIFIFRITFI